MAAGALVGLEEAEQPLKPQARVDPDSPLRAVRRPLSISQCFGHFSGTVLECRVLLEGDGPASAPLSTLPRVTYLSL